MYDFLTGPMLLVSVLVFLGGLGWRVAAYIRGLDWRLERVAYGYSEGRGTPGALSSIFKWLLPFGTHSWRQQPFMTIAFFLFHLGVVIGPLFLAGHMVVMREAIGVSLPSLSVCAGDVFTVCGLVGGTMLLLRRLALPEVRFLSDWQDWTLLSLCLFVLASGMLARFGVQGWLLWHIFAGELVLILAPFTKLSHIALYFMSRGQLGMDYAIKRGGATRGSVYPW